MGARIACLSSFFRFLIRMDIVTVNPCDKLERLRTSAPPARGEGQEDWGWGKVAEAIGLALLC
jgi:hypothetical protein